MFIVKLYLIYIYIQIVETQFNLYKIYSFTIPTKTQTEMHQEYYNTLINQQKSISDRYFAVFQLKNICTTQAIQSLINSYPFCGNSILLKHQLLYALGQLPKLCYPIVKQFLISKMEDVNQNNLSRHEAAEALANYFDQDIQKYYLKNVDSECKQLKYTCMISLQKLKHSQLQKQYGLDYNCTMQPAAPYSQQQFHQILKQKDLQQTFKQKSYIGIMSSQKLSLFEKYRIMYYMRNKKTKECIKNLCLMLTKQYFKQQCSLLKHQICFIIGQIGCQEFQKQVRQCIENQEQEDIVRHQALAAVASQSKDPIYLQKFLDNKYPQLIRQSAQVAIHSIKYWNQ